MTLNAETLNLHLSLGGWVQIGTHLRSTVYKQKHAGMFLQGSDGNLYVRRGKRKDCLSMDSGRMILVGVRFLSGDMTNEQWLDAIKLLPTTRV